MKRAARAPSELALDQAELLEGARRELMTGAGRAAGEWLSTLREWDLFGTLTYDVRRFHGGHERVYGVDVPPNVSLWKALRDVERWVDEGARALGFRPIAVVAAAEPHKSGSYHLHVLADVGGLRQGVVGILGQLWYERHGYCRLEAPRSAGDVAGYCGKYLAKDAGELWFSSSRSIVGERAKLRLLL